MIWSVTVFADDDPIKAVEFKFPTRGDAFDFVKSVFLSARFNVGVCITRRDEPKTTTVYDACTGERKEYW